MAELERRSPRGSLRIVADDEELLLPAAELVLHWESSSRPTRETVTFAGRHAHLKCDVFEGRARFANAWCTLVRPVRLPRMREYGNLIWLCDRLFQAPRPLAAGYSTRRGRTRFQFLVCEEVAQAVTFESFLDREALLDSPQAERDSERTSVLTELARELARLHALRFMHGDLTTEHILVGPTSATSRIHFLNPSRGGPRLSAGGSIREFGDLIANAGAVLREPDVRVLADAYIDERRAQGRPVDALRLMRDIEGRRRTSSADRRSPG